MRNVGIAILIAVSDASAAAEGAPYSTVEIDRFGSETGVDFPADYQISLVEDLVREMPSLLNHALLGESQCFGRQSGSGSRNAHGAWVLVRRGQGGFQSRYRLLGTNLDNALISLYESPTCEE
jgi:hypothetical protein